MDHPHLRLMMVHTFKAPAKLNLNLRVLGRRDDGFHEIDSLMVQLPGLADELFIEPSGRFSFTCDDPEIPADDRNLVVRAVRAYETATGIPCTLSIHLIKKIPHGAGLGGGSSDAAATLLALDRIHEGKLGPQRLHEIASSLGSDIPFFLQAAPARCTGRGEILHPAQAPSLPVLLLKPLFGVETSDAYGRFNRSFKIPGIAYHQHFTDNITFFNDLEKAVFSKHRYLAELKQWLLDRAETRVALMTGSGSTVFTVLKADADAEALARAARHELDPTLWHWAGATSDGGQAADLPKLGDDKSAPIPTLRP
jgi:4-diphosphocytidyl-2-C-methyl-D-erythritol kinase